MPPSRCGHRDPRENTAQHWQKHGSEFRELHSEAEYTRAAHHFVNHPPPGAMTKQDRRGDTLIYDPESNTFAVRARWSAAHHVSPAQQPRLLGAAAMTARRKHACPVCGLHTLSESGAYEICSVCGWEEDPAQSRDADFAGGANKESLNQARANWRQK